MRWQCQFHNSKGVRCAKAAVLRLQFGEHHPFDFMDVCEDHDKEYRAVSWRQTLIQEIEYDTARKSITSTGDSTEILSHADETKTKKEDNKD